MQRLMCWTFLMVFLVISLCHFQTSEACTCLYQHPQAYFCDSDFVVIVNITKLSQVAEHAVYEVEVHNILKATQQAQIALEEETVRLRLSSDAVCRHVGLIPGTTWLITGTMDSDRLYVPFCGYTKPWSQVTPHLLESFQQIKQHGCACSIWANRPRYHDTVIHSASDKTGCLLELSPRQNMCQDRYGICMPSSAGCSWISSNRTSDSYNKCMAETLTSSGSIDDTGDL